MQLMHIGIAGESDVAEDANFFEKQVHLEVTDTARAWLAEKGYDPAVGARPMARIGEEHLKKPLADAILFGPLAQGGKARVDLKDGVLGLSF